jgi:Rrf2 family nitric oxide-sensitive transcriptional repressor
MKLTRTSDAAFRILVLMAREKDRQSAQIISKALSIPYSQTAKILQNLARAGFVRTAKGKGGGVELLISADTITLADVIVAIEGPIHLMECTINKNACPLSSGCCLSQKIKEAQDCMIRVFSDSSIADLICMSENKTDKNP